MENKKVTDWRENTALMRFQIIQPLLNLTLDKAKRIQMRRKIAADNDISEKTITRWEEAFFQSGFSGLKPAERTGGRSSKLPDNFPELLQEAIQLKREVTTRSVSQIIFILEGEGKAKPGVLKRSTLQRYLFEAGLGERQLKMYRQDEQSTMTKRFCKPHRMMLVQADIKYGVGVIVMADGEKRTAYLSSIIDDHSRYILWSEWYESQDEYCVEDVFRKAVLKHGKFDKAYTDNGSQYISRQLQTSCAMLGISLKRARVRSGKSKGKIEKFHQVVDSFIAEVKLKKPVETTELNRYWQIFLNEYYHKKPHDGIREYYTSKGITVPDAGITPEQEWNRDTRALIFLDSKTVGEAFLHHEKRNVDKGGLISYKGRKYEAGAHLIGEQVIIAFDPMDDRTIIVYPKNSSSFTASPVQIGEYCVREIPVPRAVAEEPVTSRFLDVLEKKHKESQKKLADAISYSDYGD
ncbi:MAG: DDE-type integrase/transposase/recombinase [Erysipelotrichaceae bacterium]|nr:DDE-type integrase/transposase/recombinase [Erysipelotrichaceae bacterium]